MHMEQVARLSAMLFEVFEGLHGLGPWEGELLCCAALLHDVGISISFQGHHKHSRKLILASQLPALTAAERETVAAIARYHRKAAPSKKHKAYRAMVPEQRELVRRLAAILRLADGLDRGHENAVSKVAASVMGPIWTVGIYGRGDLAYAAASAARKAGLFEEVYGVKVRWGMMGA